MQHFGGANRHTLGATMPMSQARLSHLLLSTQFVIWVIYGVLAGMGHWPAGVAFGLLASVCVLALEASRRIKLKLMDWTLLATSSWPQSRRSWSARRLFPSTVP